MITAGSKVTFHYTLTVDGEVVDSSDGRDPLPYEHGSGQIIPGLERELEGLATGDRRQVEVAPDLAYGPHDPNAVQQVPRSAFQGADELNVGDAISANLDGNELRAVITAVADDTVTIDLNHPLAGKSLHFAVEIVSID